MKWNDCLIYVFFFFLFTELNIQPSLNSILLPRSCNAGGSSGSVSGGSGTGGVQTEPVGNTATGEAQVHLTSGEATTSHNTPQENMAAEAQHNTYQPSNLLFSSLPDPLS